MTRRLLLLAAVLLGGGILENAAAASAQPNVLMIVIDDMNNWVGAMGGPAKTPNIDRLAKRGVLFNEAYCVVPACNPSRASVLTGLRPETTQLFENAGNFRRTKPGNESLLTLPQHLRRHGYMAVAAGKVFHSPRGTGEQPAALSDPESWNEQYRGSTGTGGGEAYLDPKGVARWLNGDTRDIKNEYALRSAIWGPIAQKKEDTGDWKTTEYCAQFLQKQHDKPFFLACGISRPHAPLLAPKEFFDLYPIDEVRMPECPKDDMDDIPAGARVNWSTPLVKAMRKEGQWQRAVQAYLACMSFADACVGNVLAALERSPHRDNTIVVFWSDHGWQLGHKDRWEKFSLWRQATNAPFIISGPTINSGVCKAQVSFLDMAPTIMELVGLTIPEAFQGHSLRPWLKDPSLPRSTPAVVTYLPGNNSVVQGGANFIHYADGTEELYHHAEDPSEYRNIVGSPEVEPELKALRDYLPPAPLRSRRAPSSGGHE